MKRKQFPTDAQLLDWAQKNLLSLDVCRGQIEMDFETWNSETPFVYQGLDLRNALAAARAATILAYGKDTKR